MNWSIRRGRRTVPVAVAIAVYGVGIGLSGAGSAQSIGGLCNGAPATHTWLDASGQPGPTFFDGTNGDDVIVGSDGDELANCEY